MTVPYSSYNAETHDLWVCHIVSCTVNHADDWNLPSGCRLHGFEFSLKWCHDCPTGSKKVRRSTSSNVRNRKSLQQLTESFGGIWETKAFSAWVNGLCEQQVKPSQHLHLCNFRFERLHLSLQWFMKAADQLNPLGTGEGLVWHDWVC